MRRKSLLSALVLGLVILVGCKEEIDTSSRYVFKEETIASYLEKHEQYSEYFDLLGKVKVSSRSETTLRQLLSARGNYTCFVPTNDAIQAYLQGLDSVGLIDSPSWEGFLDSLSLDSTRLSALSDSLLQAVLAKRKQQAFRPDPIRSMWLGLVFPGGGQIYNRKYWKLPIFYGGFLGCAYALTWNGQMLRDYSQAYLDIMDDDPNTKSYEQMLPLGYDISGKEERFKEIFKNKKNYFRKYRDMSIFAFAGVYLLAVIDAYVDAELSSFDISPDLSMRLEPTLLAPCGTGMRHLQAAPGIQCSLTF